VGLEILTGGYTKFGCHSRDSLWTSVYRAYTVQIFVVEQPKILTELRLTLLQIFMNSASYPSILRDSKLNSHEIPSFRGNDSQ